MCDYNKYIASIDKKKCMDCGSSKVIFKEDEDNKMVKKCLICGKEYYV